MLSEFVDKVKAFDYIEASRSWNEARELYLRSGYALEAKIEPDHSAQVSANETVRRARAAIERGDDRQALDWLKIVNESRSFFGYTGMLLELSVREVAFSGIEAHLGKILRSEERTRLYLRWLEEVSPFNVVPAIRGEAASSLQRYRPSTLNPVGRAISARLMQSWSTLYEDTSGLSESPARIAQAMHRLAGRPGMSRTYANDWLESLIGPIEAAPLVAEHRRALMEVLQARVTETESGHAPALSDAAAEIARKAG